MAHPAEMVPRHRAHVEPKPKPNGDRPLTEDEPDRTHRDEAGQHPDDVVPSPDPAPDPVGEPPEVVRPGQRA